MNVTVYDKTIDVNINNPAFNYLTGVNKPYIEVKAVIRDEKKKWKETFKVSSEEKAAEQIQEVIQFFNDTLQPRETPREFVSVWIEDEELSQYKDKEGMSGWLDPNGIFHPCEFGEHGIYAREKLQIFEQNVSDVLAQNQHIPMSVDERSHHSNIAIFGVITQEQLNWFNRFFDKLSFTQKSTVQNKTKEQGLSLEYEW